MQTSIVFTVIQITFIGAVSSWVWRHLQPDSDVARRTKNGMQKFLLFFLYTSNLCTKYIWYDPGGFTLEVRFWAALTMVVTALAPGVSCCLLIEVIYVIRRRLYLHRVKKAAKLGI
jgi:hypothetical protein